MKWQSEEHVGLAEAAEWARHFRHLEQNMDRLLADLFNVEVEAIDKWIRPGRYVTGREIAESGLAEMIDLSPLSLFTDKLTTGNGAHPAAGNRRKVKARS
jgi:hypothetical protein